MEKKKKSLTKKTIYYNPADDLAKTKPAPMVIDEYYDVYAAECKPLTQSYIDRLADDLLKWAEIDEDGRESLRMNDFYNAKGMTRQTWEELCSRHPRLRIAHNHAKERLASRRDIGASRRRYDGSFIARTIGWYDHIHVEEQKRLNELKLEEEAAGRANYTVNMVTAPVTNEVPELKKDEE